jgi:hypothetical protein
MEESVDLHEEPESETLLAILGGARRSGEWTPPELLHVIAIMGGVELDFRRALLAPGMTEVHVFAVMGGVTLTIPRELDVEVTASALLGGVGQQSSSTDGVAVDAPWSAADLPRQEAGPEPRRLLVVSGMAVMGGITIRVD